MKEKLYTVRWNIEILTTSPDLAAAEAEDIMRDMIYRPHFEVSNNDDCWDIDLEEGTVTWREAD